MSPTTSSLLSATDRSPSDAGPTGPAGVPHASHRRRRSRPTITTAALYGLLGTAALLALAPLAWLLSGSLQTLPELLTGESFLPRDPQWRNYLVAWTDGDLGTYLRNSVLYTGGALVGILVSASMAGYALARLDVPGRMAITVLLLAVMVIPAPAMFLAQYKLLISLGLANNPVGYVLVLVAAGIPMSTLIMRSFFASQPRDLEEAASLDGAGRFVVFARIILPLARPGLAAVAVIQGLAAWNEYLMALVIFDDDELMPIQRGLTAFTSAETPQQQILLAATAISVIPVIVFYLVAQKNIVAGIGAGAVK